MSGTVGIPVIHGREDVNNIGIVLPEPGYLEGVRECASRYGVLLVNDETHTFSAGPGGATRAWGLEPDILIIGKSIAGGIPMGAYGLSAELADRALVRTDLDLVDMGGVMSPVTTRADVDLHHGVFRAAIAELLGG